MKTFTNAAAALGIIAAVLAGPAAEEARAEPISALLITGAAAAGAYTGGAISMKTGIAFGGTAIAGTLPMAALGAGGGALSMQAALSMLTAAAPQTAVAATPVLMTPAGLVVGATVVLTAAYIVANWDEIEDAVAEADRRAWNALAAAGGWTAEQARDAAWWTASMAAAAAERAADAGVAAWSGTKTAAAWTADVTAAGAEATWDGTKRAARATAGGTAAAWRGTAAETIAAGRWFGRGGAAFGEAGGTIWTAMRGPEPVAEAMLAHVEPAPAAR